MFKHCAIILPVLISSQVMAEDLLLGGGVGLGNVTVGDPDGDAASTASTSFSGVAILRIKDTPWWVWSDVTYQKFSLDGSPDEVGQNISSWSFNGIAQRGYKLSDNAFVWLGLGAGVSFDEFTERSFDTADGFVLEAFENRNETNVVSIANTGASIKVNDWYYGLNASYRQSLGDGINGLMVTLFVVK